MIQEKIKTLLENEIVAKNLIYPFVSGLNNREKAILEMRGFWGAEPKSLADVSNKVRVSRERVRQIENKAKDKLIYQKEIIEQLAEKLGQFLFDEEDIEKAFIEWYIQIGNPSNTDLINAKIKFQDLAKILWQKKQG